MTVSTAVTPRRYDSGDRVDCYVDALLRNGNTVAFWLEFRWKTGSWIIESSIRHSTDVDYDEVVGFPPRYAVDDDELTTELDGAARALVEAAGKLDLEAL